MATNGAGRPAIVEMAVAFAVGAIWFAFTTVVLVKPLPDSPFVTAAVVVLNVFVVLAVAHYWDIPYAVTVGVASVVALDWYYIPPRHAASFPDSRNLLALVAYLVMAALLGELAVQARRRAVQSERARSELAGEQAALRRVATLVAQETHPTEVFSAITSELGTLLGLDLATMLRYEADEGATVVASWSRPGLGGLPVGSRIELTGENVSALVLASGQPARIDDFGDAAGPLSARLRDLGVRSSAGSPITIGGSVWGVMVASTTSGEPIAPGTEARLSEFTELAATAVANAQTRTELTASRARIVASADEARRHIERDLHDGLQQRLVALALRLRMAIADVPQGGGDLDRQLGEIGDGLVEAVDSLRELSRGIHPAILAEGGLRPALASLGRRSAVPVELDVQVPDRLPEPIEVAVYYVVSEFLTNTAKHAHAEVVRIALSTGDSAVRLTISDDGVGGANLSGGSGLVGLTDRVHALGGTLHIDSPVDGGTTARVTIPLELVAKLDPLAGAEHSAS